MKVFAALRLCGEYFLLLLMAGCTHKPSGPLAFVTNERDGTITVIDTNTDRVYSTITVGGRLRGIRLSHDKKKIWVAISYPSNQSQGEDKIAELDVNGKIIAKYEAGTDPENFAIDDNATHLYIANEDAGAISVLNTADGKVEHQIPVAEEPEGVAFTPNGKSVYATCETAGDIFVINTAQYKTTAHFVVGGRPRNVVFSPDGSRAYIPSESTGIVHIIDTLNQQQVQAIQLPTNSRPMCLVMSKDGKQLYLSTGWGASICVVDIPSLKILNNIKVGPRPWGFAMSPDGKQLFVANGPSNDISVVDLTTGAETARIKAGQSPWGVAIVPVPSSP